MKNLFTITTAFLLFNVTTLFAQDTLPMLTIDSTLTVGNDVHVGNKMTIAGETQMSSDATAQRDLIVEGNIYGKNDVFITGNLDVTGMATLNAAKIANGITAPNLTATTTLNGFNLVVVKSDGTILKSDVSALGNVLYSKSCSSVNGIIESPQWNNGPNKLFVACPEVKVGIGTPNPTHWLHTLGAAKFENSMEILGSVGIGLAPDSFSKFEIKNQTKSAAFTINNSGFTGGQYGKLLFLQYTEPSTEIMKVVNTTTGTTTFGLNANGEMFVNNGTRKTFQLNAGGLLQARRILIDQENWADFVFDNDYKLMPVQELKTYVGQNKHLPDVPSAQQVQRNGVDVAEMNKILLQKIEELTLYLIEQNDNTTVLKAQVEALQAKITALETAK